MARRKRKPQCIVIAGPNGAGKTTFARRYLPEHGVIHFVNADLIASGSWIGGQLGCVRQLGRRTTAIGGELMKAKTRAKAGRAKNFAAGVGRALRRAAKDARKTARMHGTPVYVLKNGKIVAEKP